MPKDLTPARGRDGSAPQGRAVARFLAGPDRPTAARGGCGRLRRFPGSRARRAHTARDIRPAGALQQHRVHPGFLSAHTSTARGRWSTANPSHGALPRSSFKLGACREATASSPAANRPHPTPPTRPRQPCSRPPRGNRTRWGRTRGAYRENVTETTQQRAGCPRSPQAPRVLTGAAEGQEELEDRPRRRAGAGPPG